MTVKRLKQDDVFSKLVRCRANYTCEHCGSTDPEVLQCAHIISRKYHTLRWHPDNAVCLCASCHMNFTDDPVGFGNWVNSYIGEGLIDLLNEIRYSGRKITKPEKEDLHKDYKAQLKKMEEERVFSTERIEFVYPL